MDLSHTTADGPIDQIDPLSTLTDPFRIYKLEEGRNFHLNGQFWVIDLAPAADYNFPQTELPAGRRPSDGDDPSHRGDFGHFLICLDGQVGFPERYTTAPSLQTLMDLHAGDFGQINPGKFSLRCVSDQPARFIHFRAFQTEGRIMNVADVRPILRLPEEVESRPLWSLSRSSQLPELQDLILDGATKRCCYDQPILGLVLTGDGWLATGSAEAPTFRQLTPGTVIDVPAKTHIGCSGKMRLVLIHPSGMEPTSVSQDSYQYPRSD